MSAQINPIPSKPSAQKRPPTKKPAPRRGKPVKKKSAPVFSLSGGALKLAILAAVTLVAVIVIIALSKGGTGKNTSGEPLPASSPSVIEPLETAEPTEPASKSLMPDIFTSGAVSEMLPIYTNGSKSIKRVAITVDDLNQAKNLEKILDLCEAYNAKVTLFVLGTNVSKCASQLRRAYQMGIEIGNHTYDHVFTYKLEDDELIAQLSDTSAAVNSALGLTYHMNFMRPPGGNGKDDPRLHATLIQGGYKGVAHWNHSGTTSYSKIVKNLKNGDVILFHTKDSDLKNLQQLIPYLASQGYEMVTLSEMFGLDKPAVEPYDPNYTPIAAPLVQPYSCEGITFKKGVRMYGVKLLQQRLIALNYLADGNADGDFGAVTEEALKLFQTQAGLAPTGILDDTTRERMYDPSAPAYFGTPLTSVKSN